MNSQDEKSVKKFKKWLLYSIDGTNALWKRVVFWLVTTVVVITAIVTLFIGLLLLLLQFRGKISAVYVPWLYFLVYLISMSTVGITFFFLFKYFYKNKIGKTMRKGAFYKKHYFYDKHKGSIDI